ncbi:MAG: formimidoylglutamate deiminase, partial [Pseudomonadota bacterium]
MTTSLFARQALLECGWAENVEIRIDADGVIQSVETGTTEPANATETIKGPVIPGVSNCHSHAFQRAMVGLAETRSRN